MGIPRSYLWLVVTGLIVAGLVGLSYLALDKPNVVWTGGTTPHCPHCRTEVPFYARRCPACREEFDWLPTGDEDSPTCTRCLAPSEEAWIRERRKKFGDEAAFARVAKALEITPAAAASYLKSLARGQCGWCGGTGRDLSTTDSTVCPVCFGEKACIGCDGDRKVQTGKEAAARELDRYQLSFSSETMLTPLDDLRRRLRDADEAFLKKNVGTSEAALLRFWPTTRFDDLGQRRARLSGSTAAGESRGRIKTVMDALVPE